MSTAGLFILFLQGHAEAVAHCDQQRDRLLARIESMEQAQREMQEKFDSLQTETRADKARLQDELQANGDRLIALERQVAAIASNQQKWDCAGTKRKAQTAQTGADGAMQIALEAQSMSSATKLAQEADRARVTHLERQVWDLSSPCF